MVWTLQSTTETITGLLRVMTSNGLQHVLILSDDDANPVRILNAFVRCAKVACWVAQ